MVDTGSIDKIKLAYSKLKEYQGNNSYIIRLKNSVYVYKNTELNDFNAEFIIKNYDFEPKFIGKVVTIAEWWGKILQNKHNLSFTPQRIEIGYYLGEANGMYVFFARFTTGQKNGVMLITKKEAVFTDFLSEDYNKLQVDFDRYDKLAARFDEGRKIKDSQKEGIKFLLSRKKCILADDMGYGKMEPIDSLIPTPDGFKLMGNIKPGDKVFGSNGQAINVLKTFYHEDKDIYKVVFDDNTSCECGLEHLWVVKDTTKEDAKWETVSLQDIVDRGIYYKDSNDEEHPRFEIPICNPVEYQEKEYNVDINGMGILFNQIGEVWSAYKLGNIKQRINLLASILGCNVEEINGKAFTTKKEKLSFDVMELVNSLGGICEDYTPMRNGDVSFKIRLDTDSILNPEKEYKEKSYKKHITNVTFSRKSDAQCLAVDSEDHTYLTSKNYIVTHNTLELTVAAVEGNYDSVLIICPASIKTNWKKELSYYVPEKDITIIDSFNSMKKGELENFLGYKEGGSGMKREELLEEAKKNGKWQDNKFVIVNFDIIDEFYKMPKKSKVSIAEAYAKSPILQFIMNKKSLLIVDEAHKLSTNDSIRYKVIDDLIKRGKPESVYLATGTPITNNPQNFYYVLKLLNHPLTANREEFFKRYCDAKKICCPRDREKRNKISENFIKAHGRTTWYDLSSTEKTQLQKLIERNCWMMTIANGATNLDELRERVSDVYIRRVKEDLGVLPEKQVDVKFYDLTESQYTEYLKLWEEYEAEKKEENPDKELNKELLEGALYRKYLSNQMVPNTEKIVDDLISRGEKVVVACCYDEELYTLKEYYGDKCVIYNGKVDLRHKDAAIKAFYEDPNVMVFIGNINAAGVGVTLTCANHMVFNNMSYVPADNRQMEDRIFRLGQKNKCYITYQMFSNTQYEKMWNKVLKKELVIDQVIKKEGDKR